MNGCNVSYRKIIAGKLEVLKYIYRLSKTEPHRLTILELIVDESIYEYEYAYVKDSVVS